MKYLKLYPRITSLLIGFVLGLFVVLSNVYSSSVTLSEYKSIVKVQNERYEQVIAKSHTEIESLSRINETLKQHIKTRKVTQPDGTIVEETDTDTNTTTVTETEIRKTIQAEYDKRLAEKMESISTVDSKNTSKKLRFGFGYNSNLEYYGHGSYPISGPFIIGGGMDQSVTVMLNIGIEL